jgi:hypothetical protein
MKIDDLRKALKTLIREEVKKAVTEEVNRAMGKVLVEMVKEIKLNDKRNIIESTEEPLQEVIHTKNPKLNSVLAETARYSKPLPKDLTTNLAELMDGGFDKIGTYESTNVEEPKTNMGFIKQMVGESVVPQQKSVLDSGNVPDILKGVFKKDFRAVMKKIDETKKSGGSGMIDPSRVLGG